MPTPWGSKAILEKRNEEVELEFFKKQKLCKQNFFLKQYIIQVYLQNLFGIICI